MYTKDLEKRLTLRLTQEQFDHLAELSEAFSMKPSDVLRMMISSSLYSFKKAEKQAEEKADSIAEIIKEGLKKGDSSNENDKTYKHDKLQ